MRAHIIVNDELVNSIDKLVGSRNRSKFFVEAVEERLKRIKRVKLAKKLAGSLANVDIPGWETSESAAEWVHKSRLESDKRNG
jgi:metal-responsive CopG/Arc/MetJ family transcriptional regulator